MDEIDNSIFFHVMLLIAFNFLQSAFGTCGVEVPNAL